MNDGYYSGRAATRTYDARNRLYTLSFPDGRGNQTWDYTPDGLPEIIYTNNANGGEQVINAYSYNNRRMLEGESKNQVGWYMWSAGQGYDANGSLSTQTYPSGLIVYRRPNALGQATQLDDQVGNYYATGISYYPNGAPASFTYGNGIVHSMQQNARQLPARSTDGAIADLSYTYDLNGNVTQAIDYVDGTQSRGMNYDGLDRLTQTTSNMFGTANYTYDVLDNLTRVTVGASSNHAARDYGYCYDGSWRLTSIRSASCWGAEIIGLSYDAQGNLASKAGQAYSFDFGNRLRSTPGLETYRYDGMGRRVLNRHASGDILSMYNQAGQLVYSSSGRTGLNQEHIYLGSSLVGIREHGVGSPQVIYQHTDALGSPIATTVSGQTVLSRTGYEPFGAQVLRPLTDGVGYTGHVQDAATGLTYMQQRYYDPLVGRFLSVDPVSAEGGTRASFNRYWYANNNPYHFTDPDGREVKIVGSEDFRRKVSKDIATIQSGANGGNLMKDANETKQVITITESTGRNSTTYPKGNNGKPSDSTIKYNPSQTEGGTDAKGSTTRPAYVGLGHELGHAVAVAEGVQSTDRGDKKPGTTPPSEKEAMDAENGIRRDHKLPERPSYYQ